MINDQYGDNTSGETFLEICHYTNIIALGEEEDIETGIKEQVKSGHAKKGGDFLINHRNRDPQAAKFYFPVTTIKTNL